MKIFYSLLLLFCTFQLKAQEIIEEQAFYFEKIPIKNRFFFNTDPYENQKLVSFIIEMSGLPKVNAVNSKYFKENDYSVFEIYNEKKGKRIRIEYKVNENKAYDYYSNGKVKHEIPFKNKKVNGIYKEYSSDGNLLYEVTFKDNIRNGLSKYYTENQKIIECDFVNNKIVNKIKVTDNSRNTTILYPSNFEKGQIEYYTSSGKLSLIVPFTNREIINGKVIFYNYPIFKRIEFNHKDGLLDGKLEYFDYNDNLVQSGLYKNGKPIGEHKIFWYDGKLFEERHYDDTGTKIGVWRTYKNNGKIEKETPYQNGKINGLEKSYLDGQLINTKEFADDKQNGISTVYRGNLKQSETLFKNDKRVNWTHYFSSGKIGKKVEYKDNGIAKTITCYDLNGNAIYEYKAKENSTNVELEYIYKNDDTYFLATEAEYNKDDFKVREKYFYQNNDFNETLFFENGNKMIIKSVKGVISKEFYTRTKKVTESEFNKSQVITKS